jgi:hypothetical protein
MNAQSDAQRFLNHLYLQPEILAQNQIRSVHIITEIRSEQEDYDYYPNVLLKILESEYNESGYCTYKKVVKHSNGSFDYFNSEYEKLNYNNKNQIIKHCYNQNNFSYCQDFTFDSEGNITKVKNEGGRDSVSFIWKKGKMIEVINHVEQQNFSRTFDEKGRFTGLKSEDGFKLEKSFEDYAEYTVESATHYLKDSLVSKTIQSSLQPSNLVTYYCELNSQLDTIIVQKVRYNEHMHPVSIFSKTFITVDEFPESSSPEDIPLTPFIRSEEKEFKIYNFYDGAFLVKREIYELINGIEQPLIRKDLIIYEKEPLHHQAWPKQETELYYAPEGEDK